MKLFLASITFSTTLVLFSKSNRYLRNSNTLKKSIMYIAKWAAHEKQEIACKFWTNLYVEKVDSFLNVTQLKG